MVQKLEHVTNGCSMGCTSQCLFYSSPWKKLGKENNVDKKLNYRYRQEHREMIVSFYLYENFMIHLLPFGT
jgi:hypothetical protein